MLQSSFHQVPQNGVVFLRIGANYTEGRIRANYTDMRDIK